MNKYSWADIIDQFKAEQDKFDSELNELVRLIMPMDRLDFEKLQYLAETDNDNIGIRILLANKVTNNVG